MGKRRNARFAERVIARKKMAERTNAGKKAAEANSKSDADFVKGLSKTVAQIQTLDAKDQPAATDLLKRIKITAKRATMEANGARREAKRARMELGESSGAE